MNSIFWELSAVNISIIYRSLCHYRSWVKLEYRASQTGNGGSAEFWLKELDNTQAMLNDIEDNYPLLLV